MTKSPKEKAALRQDKLPNQTTDPKHIIEKARAHLFGVCLLDASFVHYLPASIHLSEYGAFTLAMIKQGMGIEAIISHLEAVGLDNAKEMLIGAIVTLPDNADYSHLFYNAIQVLIFKGTTV